MFNSAKWGWSAAAGMTIVSAILAGMLWGRSQTTPAANAQSIDDLLRSLPAVKRFNQESEDPAITEKEAAAELAEIRERANVRLFDHSVWSDGPLPVAPAPANHPDDLPQDQPPPEEPKFEFEFHGRFQR